jgi:prepilin-type N-terminal cleavage/methylation domain-containing protein/prepilin-type processing-associated H-X9-DG protein
MSSARAINKRCNAFNRISRSYTPFAFTLVELLVVIAVIAILAALLLPVLSKAKARGLSVACMNNLKQLETCLHLYTLDHNDLLVPNNSVVNLDSGNAIVSSASWCTNYAPFDAEPDGIYNALLFPYNTSLAIYRCPADHSTVETRAGVKLAQLRWRSISLSQSVNGAPELSPLSSMIPSYKKLTKIVNPGPSKLIDFLDVHEDEIYDSMFGMPPMRVFVGADFWWDVPANRHMQGCNFSFADGHTEHWKWRVAKVVAVRSGIHMVPNEELPDYRRVQDVLRQDFD